MKIGIFGGTFSPTHKGHMLIAEHAWKKLKLDKLIFLPAWQNPFKKKDVEVDVHHRLEMLKIALQSFFLHKNNAALATKWSISDFEINRQTISYTIDSVRYFCQKYPDAKIYWLIGADNVKKLHKWKAIKQISQLVKITIFKRGGDVSHINNKKYDTLSLDNPLLPFSSSLYKKGYLEVVDKAVQIYIAKHYLYLQDIMKNWLTPMRYNHCFFTAKLCALYAKQLHSDVKEAYWCGLLHDLTKNWSLQKHQNLLQVYNVQIGDYALHDLHGLSASVWLKNVYLLNNEKVLKAISIHTSLAMELSLLDKILYAGDKLCQGRKWKDIQKIRDLIQHDFDQGFKQLVIIVYQRLKKENKIISEKQHAIYQKWTE